MAGQVLAETRSREAIVAHLDQALGQDVSQKAADKLLSGKGARLGFAGVGGAITGRHHERILSTTFSAGVSRAPSLPVAHLGPKIGGPISGEN